METFLKYFRKTLRIILSLVAIYYGIYLLLFIIGTIVLNSSDKGFHKPTSVTPVVSNDIDASKNRNVFLWEYEPIEVQYKDAVIKVSSAFVERSQYYLKDSLYTNERVCNFQIFLEDYRPLKYKGYRETWLINDYLHLVQFGRVKIEYGDYSCPPDTFKLYIRECTPSMDSLKTNYPSTTELEHYLKWDTVQCIDLIRK